MSNLVDGLAAIYGEHRLDISNTSRCLCGADAGYTSDDLYAHIAELQASWLREHLHEVAEERGMKTGTGGRFILDWKRDE